MRDEFASLLAQAGAKGTAVWGGFELPVWLSDRVWYYVICAVTFTLAGLITGYFIWRKGSMQMHDAEAEIQRTGEELKRLTEDLKIEESAL
jgi:hypothetical protein